ncbi:MAG: DUF3488 domain-containing transglutaminase family protein [Gammaproteobacteria bacterium]|nr:DUF3488 domain-containing transglutaminase family protein [Gammaproteobacteria bacterium]
MTPRTLFTTTLPRAQNHPALAWVTAAFGGGVLLHADRLPFWCVLVVLTLIAWRLAGELQWLPTPARSLRALLTVTLVFGVVGSFRTLNGLAAGTALLAVMGAAKLLEARTRRDYLIVIGTALFLLLAACLDRQALLRVPLYGAQVWLSCTALALAANADAPAFGARRALSLAGRTLLLALPLAVALFLFFPRIAGGFWALPPGGAALTGLSDEMSPGSIAELTENDAPAFRTWFLGATPPPEERYWRGPVLNDFDGYTWRQSRASFTLQTPLEYLGPGYRYRIALEPHSHPWWFALEMVRGAPDARAQFQFDYQLSSAPVAETVTYEAVSYPRTRAAGTLSVLGRRVATRLPPGRNPRARAFAERLRASSISDAVFVQAVLGHFRTGGFEYTLTPPRTDFDFVDDFLFTTRRGFCGHYASAFVALMRAGGVPARVVTGYLGAEWNPVGRYFIVRQSDAHAWAEVWLEGRGWTRIDPTAVVSPERLSRGILDLLPDAVSAPARLVHALPWLATLRFRWDAANTWWQQHVVGFDLRSQLALLGVLGFARADLQQLVAVLAAVTLGWLAWILWETRRTARVPRRDALARAWLGCCAALAPIAARRAHEGPLAYAGRIARARPGLGAELHDLAAAYARLRFGRDADEAAIRDFVRRAARFRRTRRFQTGRS